MGGGKNKQAAGTTREQRLKQALKANLQRRKAQAKARADIPQDKTDKERGQDG